MVAEVRLSFVLACVLAAVVAEETLRWYLARRRRKGAATRRRLRTHPIVAPVDEPRFSEAPGGTAEHPPEAHVRARAEAGFRCEAVPERRLPFAACGRWPERRSP